MHIRRLACRKDYGLHLKVLFLQVRDCFSYGCMIVENVLCPRAQANDLRSFRRLAVIRLSQRQHIDDQSLFVHSFTGANVVAGHDQAAIF